MSEGENDIFSRKLILKVRGSKINNSGFQGQGSLSNEVWDTLAHSILLLAVCILYHHHLFYILCYKTSVHQNKKINFFT
jgi:hypothetical protein